MLLKKICNKLLFCAIVLLPFGLLANWSTFDTPELTEKSKAISTQVNTLPEQHLADKHDQSRAANILINTFEQQQSHAKQLDQQLRQFRTSKDPSAWPVIEQTKLSLDSLSQNKAKLLTYVSVSINEQFTGFGPDGVRQLLLEIQVTEAIINYQLVSQFRHLVDRKSVV